MKYAVLLLLAACADPVVDMQLVVPDNSAQLDTSCVASVEVHVNGPSFPTDKTDTRMSCMPLDASSPTYGQLIASIRGKFQVGTPVGGLASVEVYGWNGPCDTPQGSPPPDLIFFTSQRYSGDDLLEMKLVPNLDCRPSQVNVHLVDVMALVSGPNPTDANCTAAAAPDGNAGSDLVTVMPRLFDKGLDIYGGRSGAASHNSVASFTALTGIGPKSCLAWDAGDDTAGSLACVSSTPSVCAAPGEIEAAIVPDAIYMASMKNDPNAVKYSYPILGTVWTGTTGKHPAAGATIDIDPSEGVVEYVDPPDAGSSTLKKLSTNSTGASGLFLVFTNTLAPVKVNYNGKTTTQWMAAPPDGAGGAIFVVN